MRVALSQTKGGLLRQCIWRTTSRCQPQLFVGMMSVDSSASSSEDTKSTGENELVREAVSGILGQLVDVSVGLTVKERAELFDQLSRAAELRRQYQPGERQVWTLGDLCPVDRERLSEPHIDLLVTSLRGRLLRGLPDEKSPWPKGRSFAVCLSHDMDHVTSFAGRERWRLLQRARVGGASLKEQVRLFGRATKSTISDSIKRNMFRQRDRYDNVGSWLALEAECGVKSSLFFFAQNIQPWHPFDCNYGFSDRVKFEGVTTTVGQMMREISSRGWDIGVHGSINSAVRPGVLELQKEEIERVIDRAVVTCRQHYLEYDLCRTPQIQATAGLLADGTQGFNDTVGFRAGTSFPYRVWDWSMQRLLPLWQVPLHIQDGGLLRNLRTVDQALEVCMQFLDRVQRVGGCLGVLFHPFNLATDTGFVIYRELLREIRRRNAWGCSMREVVEWWQARIRRINNRVSQNFPAL